MTNLNLMNGDCLEKLKTLPANSVDAIVTDPPYGISFMGSKWDYDVPSEAIWRECLRVLKPGGYLLAFASTRTQHRMAVRVEDAGFEIRDMLSWVYGSGFPKNLNVSASIDKKRHERDDILKVTAWIRFMRDLNGLTNGDIDRAFGFRGMAGHWTSSKTQPAIPTLEQVDQLLGVLKCPRDQVPPNIEKLLFELNGRKGTPGQAWQTAEVIGEHDKVAQAAKWRETYTGQAHANNPEIKAPNSEAAKKWQGWGTALKPAVEPITMARKPFRGTVAECVQEWGTSAMNIGACQVPGETVKVHNAPAGSFAGGDLERGSETVYREKDGRYPANLIHDGSDEVLEHFPKTGNKSAGRFFYCAKPTTAEREEGTEALGGEEGKRKNIHPTVKPVDLMAYLCRLVCQPGGVILDPFMGSGSTGKAALAEGFSFIGIERDPEFFKIAQARCGVAPASEEENDDGR